MIFLSISNKKERSFAKECLINQNHLKNKKVLVSLERELHIPELREKLENYINTVDENIESLIF